MALARFEVVDVGQEHGQQSGGAFSPSRSGDVDLPQATHAITVEVGDDGVATLTSALVVGQAVEKPVVGHRAEERDHLRVGAEHVGDVQQCQAHLGSDVVGGGQGQDVGRSLLFQPLGQSAVEPPGRLDAGHDRLMARGSEQQGPQFPDVGPDVVEQLGPRTGADLTP